MIMFYNFNTGVDCIIDIYISKHGNHGAIKGFGGGEASPVGRRRRCKKYQFQILKSFLKEYSSVLNTLQLPVNMVVNVLDVSL